ncbi:DoxX family protein [Nocardia sp. NPDC051030]|uniref:DoxX family protein n=1 Tax=Nocardia sp. NPDC051030 TaxID=3155162 RepID=UPI0034479EC4
MGAVVAEPDLDQRTGEPAPKWNPATRILFRVSFLYFGLFCLIYPQPLFSFLGPLRQWLPDDAVYKYATWPSSLVHWVGRTVFDADATIRTDSGSGDQVYMWMLVFVILVVSVIGTLVWTILDRRRTEYRRLAGWFLLFIRFVLAGQMLLYGFAKLVPNQMPEPPLSMLLRPLGSLSTTSMLWMQVGSSPVYEMLLGSAEVLAGVLLLLPRTAMAGVLLSLVSMAQVWILNMCFDVPVKLLSGHLLLLSLVLLAPELRRLTAFLTGRATGPSDTPEPVRSRRGLRILAIAQVALLCWFGAAEIMMANRAYHEWGPGRPKSELYGIWQVTEFTRDGQSVPPLLTDETRWRRVVFEEPERAFAQRMDGALAPMTAQFDTIANTVVLQSPKTGKPVATFAFDRPATDRLVLIGELDGRPVSISLELINESQWPLRHNGTHLIQDYPGFN